MDLPDLQLPPCPNCKADRMYHRCVSHIPGRAAFRQNGWYCEACCSGPYQLGNVREDEAAVTAASLAALGGHPSGVN